MKNERAITIVSLVVTLIILLILAGVTINLILGENGLIGKAQFSSNMYAEITINEMKMMEEFELDIVKENTLVNKFKNGTIKIGDYVNYTIPTEGSFNSPAIGNEFSNGFALQTYNTNNNGNEIKWRVLGLGDSEGNLTQNTEDGKHILLISDNPVQKNINNNSENKFDKDPYFYMGKAEGYVNAENVLNEISKIYANDKLAENARSININDINNILDIEIDMQNNIIYNKNDSSMNNIDITRRMGNTYNFSNMDYSAKSYASSKITAIENGEISEIINAYTYMLDSVDKNIANFNIIKEILFSQVSGNNSKPYWLASTAVNDIYNKARYTIGEVSNNMVNLSDSKFSSDGSWTVKAAGVRPIIILKSTITEDDLQVIESNTEEWNYANSLCYYGDTRDYDTTGTEISIY